MHHQGLESNSDFIELFFKTCQKSSCSPWQIKSCFTSATMHFGYEGSENAGQEINQIYKVK